MDKDQVAAILEEIARLLELQGENPFRCNAYAKAGRSHRPARKPSRRDRQGRPTRQDSRHRRDLARQDHHARHHRPSALLRRPQDEDAARPARDAALARHRAQEGQGCCTISSASTISTSSRRPARAGQSPSSKASARRRRRKSSKASRFSTRSATASASIRPWPLAEMLDRRTARSARHQRMELCGSLRRRRETIKDIDILVSSDDAGADHGRVRRAAEGEAGVGHGETKSSVTVGPDRHQASS